MKNKSTKGAKVQTRNKDINRLVDIVGIYSYTISYLDYLRNSMEYLSESEKESVSHIMESISEILPIFGDDIVWRTIGQRKEGNRE